MADYPITDALVLPDHLTLKTQTLSSMHPMPYSCPHNHPNAQHVHHLTLCGCLPALNHNNVDQLASRSSVDSYHQPCPSVCYLQSLKLTYHSASATPSDAALVSLLQHNLPTLTNVEMSYNSALLEPVWDQLVSHSVLIDGAGLHSLVLHNISLSTRSTGAFWELCRSLEKLDMWQVVLPMTFLEVVHPEHARRDGSLDVANSCPRNKSPHFQRMKTLKMAGMYPYLPALMQLSVFLVSVGPTLRHLDWELAPKEKFPSNSFVASHPLWPHLEHLSIRSQQMEGYAVASLLKTCASPCLKTLELPESKFGQVPLKVLKNSGAMLNLQVLDLNCCLSLTSPMIQEILCSFTNLVTYKGGRLHAKDILHGGPWVCDQLETLVLYIHFNDESWRYADNSKGDKESSEAEEDAAVQYLDDHVGLKMSSFESDPKSDGSHDNTSVDDEDAVSSWTTKHPDSSTTDALLHERQVPPVLQFTRSFLKYYQQRLVEQERVLQQAEKNLQDYLLGNSALDDYSEDDQKKKNKERLDVLKPEIQPTLSKDIHPKEYFAAVYNQLSKLTKLRHCDSYHWQTTIATTDIKLTRENEFHHSAVRFTREHLSADEEDEISHTSNERFEQDLEHHPFLRLEALQELRYIQLDKIQSDWVLGMNWPDPFWRELHRKAVAQWMVLHWPRLETLVLQMDSDAVQHVGEKWERMFEGCGVSDNKALPRAARAMSEYL